MKICIKCKKELQATSEYFHRDKSKKDGLYPQCKECVKKYYQKNKEKILERHKNNKEQRNRKTKEWHKNRPEYRKEWYEENKEQRKEYYKEWYKDNKIEKDKQNKEYHQKPALYNTYVHQIEWCEEVRRNTDLLEVTCTKCKTWFIPTNKQIQCRIRAINGNVPGNTENRFYCSDKCKNVCDIYGKTVNTLMKDHAVKAGRVKWHDLQRELQTELKNMVLERDDYTCQKCESKDNLECHHIIPVAYDPIESADMDVCITYCEDCHKKAHQQPECTTGAIAKNSILQECY